VTRFAFHTGVPDGADNNGDGQVDEFNSLSGYEEEPLKGKVLWTETTLATGDVGGPYAAQTDGLPADDAVVFTREYHDWRVKTIHGLTNGFAYRDAFGAMRSDASIPYATTDGKRVSYAYAASTTKEIIEAPAYSVPLRPGVFAFIQRNRRGLLRQHHHRAQLRRELARLHLR
jgi:hypothetical protein